MCWCYDFRQGNGHERDFLGNPDVYIMDVYNFGIYPGDIFAKSMTCADMQ